MRAVVVEGVFEKYSNGTWVNGINVINLIELNGVRYEKVVWSDHMENFVRDALGKKVRLSLGKVSGHYLLGAIECNGRIEKEPNKSFTGYSQLGAIGIGVFALILAAFSYKMMGEMSSYLVMFFGFPAWLYFGKRARYNKVANALDKPTVPGTVAGSNAV
jgi:hypothetical protein